MSRYVESHLLLVALPFPSWLKALGMEVRRVSHHWRLEFGLGEQVQQGKH